MNDGQDEVASVHSRDSDHVQVYVDDEGTHHYVEENDHQYDQDYSNSSGFDPRAMSRAASSFMAAAQAPPKKRATSSANNSKLPGSSSGNPNAGPNSNSNSASQKAAMKNAKGAAKAVKNFITAQGWKFW